MLTIHRNAVWIIELSLSIPSPAPFAQKRAIACKHRHAVATAIGHKDLLMLVDCNAIAILKLPIACAFRAHGSEESD
jgi:hypothetical protein